MAVNLATKYVKQLDSKYAHKSICKQAFGASYDFTGVQTVKIYTLLGADLGDYTMSGTSRYGTATEVEDTVQELTVTRDRAVTKSIDKKNYKQGMLKTTVGAFVKVQQETKNIPEMDTYALAKLSAVATAAGNKDTTTATSANAYTLLLAGSEHQDDNFIPESGRIAFCTPAYINLLKQDDNFTNTASETGSKRAINGEVGTVDGIRIIKAPKAWLPTKCNFILTHPAAGAFPRVINDLRTHEDPPGLNGALIEMREVYDCFVLEQKKESIYTNFNV